MKQGSLLKTMSYFLQSKYKTVKTTADYIYAIGDIPIALVAHMDTVFPKPVSELYYDTRKNVMWSPRVLELMIEQAYMRLFKYYVLQICVHISFLLLMKNEAALEHLYQLKRIVHFRS